MQENLYIVIPAYNEEMNIEAVAREWHEVVASCSKGSRLVIIDDGSKDDTSRVLGIPLMELNLKKGLLITCINRGRKTIIPSGSSVIHKGDSVMVAVVSGQRIYSLNDILAD